MSDVETPEAPSQTPATPATAAPPDAAAPKGEAHLTEGYRQHVDALLKGEAPTAGTEDLVDDLRGIAQKQGEARQALQQASQFLQAKQAEVVGLEGEASALMRVLKRAEDAATRKT